MSPVTFEILTLLAFFDLSKVSSYFKLAFQKILEGIPLDEMHWYVGKAGQIPNLFPSPAFLPL